MLANLARVAQAARLKGLGLSLESIALSLQAEESPLRVKATAVMGDMAAAGLAALRVVLFKGRLARPTVLAASQQSQPLQPTAVLEAAAGLPQFYLAPATRR